MFHTLPGEQAEAELKGHTRTLGHCGYSSTVCGEAGCTLDREDVSTYVYRFSEDENSSQYPGTMVRGASANRNGGIIHD